MKNLESIGKDTGFTVPDGYYDELFQKMMGKVAVEKQKTIHRRQILRFSLVTSAAAAVALLITVNVFLKTDQVNQMASNNPTIQVVKDSIQVTDQNVLAENQTQTIEEVAIAEKPVAKKTEQPVGSNSVSSYEQLTDLNGVQSVLGFYEDDAHSDQFQETLMDLDFYYDF